MIGFKNEKQYENEWKLNNSWSKWIHDIIWLFLQNLVFFFDIPVFILNYVTVYYTHYKSIP